MSEQPARPEKLEPSEQQEQEEVKSMTVGRMEDVRDLLKIDAKTFVEIFLGRKKTYDTSEKQQLEREQSLIKEFLSAEENLDSNTKKKLYHHIFEENWKPKLEEITNLVERQMQELARMKELNQKGGLSEEEGAELYRLQTENTKTGRLRELADGIKVLADFGFDEQKLKELKERLKSLKKK